MQLCTKIDKLAVGQNNILAARTLASIVRTSIGPRGLDKLLVSPGKLFCCQWWFARVSFPDAHHADHCESTILRSLQTATSQ